MPLRERAFRAFSGAKSAISAFDELGCAAVAPYASAGHDPNATEAKPQRPGKGACWTSISNPTAQHADDAKKHHELAQKHRAAAAALSSAEASACAGITRKTPQAPRALVPTALKARLPAVAKVPPVERTEQVGRTA